MDEPKDLMKQRNTFHDNNGSAAAGNRKPEVLTIEDFMAMDAVLDGGPFRNASKVKPIGVDPRVIINGYYFW